MSSLQRVAHVGASGFIGTAVLHALLDNNLDVTVLARKDSESKFPGHVKVVRIDFSDRSSLVESLRGYDAVVSKVGVRAINSQYEMIDAAVEAGVKRFIPSEYGCDITISKTANLPAYKERLDIKNYLQSKAETPETGFSYTTISTSILVEAVVGGPLPDIQPRARTATIYDGGDVPVSMTPASLVGEAVAAVLQHPEQTRNRSVLIHGGAFTQNQFLSIVQRCVGADGWQVNRQDTSEMEERSWKAYEKTPKDVLSWLPGFVRLGLFGKGYGGDFTGRTANEELGLKTISLRDLDALIERLVSS
ncbi:hypothetical protein PRZ48_010856 [Zasmidium cellare]|uniref:NmrA-like domain-containing protein n=1 Tax=Zasmidium cellare TaxID=395010 RepID=A0ABR0E9U8_ZASCE|nr:hypothetical protein PRZ48_010856 [Zasmidium cellare]